MQYPKSQSHKRQIRKANRKSGENGKRTTGKSGSVSRIPKGRSRIAMFFALLVCMILMSVFLFGLSSQKKEVSDPVKTAKPIPSSAADSAPSHSMGAESTAPPHPDPANKPLAVFHEDTSRSQHNGLRFDAEINKEHHLPPSMVNDKLGVKYREYIPAEAHDPWPCRHSLACMQPSTCNLSTGNCESRLVFKERRNGGSSPYAPQILSITPAIAAPGDMITIDGDGLYLETRDGFRSWRNGKWVKEEVYTTLTRLFIGGREVPPGSMTTPDVDRLVIKAEPWMQGEVVITFDTLNLKTVAPTPIQVRRELSGIQACKENDPPAWGNPGEYPHIAGPYASAYVDVHKPDPFTRIYYPAVCGGLRRQPVKGKFGVALILRGDGASPINYEYLARHLASWGFFVVNPSTDDPSVLKKTLQIALKTPEYWFPSFSGRTLSNAAALIGHSRGSERAEKLVQVFGARLIKGVVYLGPYRPSLALPCLSMLFSASGDHQALPSFTYALWSRQINSSHFVFIKGGNHSQFTDVRHWEVDSDNDAQPLMSRNDQFKVVQGYTLAFLQQAFQQEEHFAFLLRGEQAPQYIEHLHK